MTRILIPLLIGASHGAFTGYYGQRNSGIRSLTSTWWRGANYGGFIELLFIWGLPR